MSTVKPVPKSAPQTISGPGFNRMPETARPPSRFAPESGRDGREFMASLAKGLSVLAAFNRDRPSMSLTEAAAVAGLSRAAARRVLLTLAELGYVEQEGRDFTLAPRVLDLGFAYLSIQSWVERVEPQLKAMSGEFQAAATAATLHGAEIVVVAQIAAPQSIISPAMTVGSRLPAFHSALGRVQLGSLNEHEIWTRLRAVAIEQYTPSTIVDLGALFERARADWLQGFSIVDEELERGLRAIAVPVVSRGGAAMGAISLSAHAARTTRNEMRDLYLPRLREAAAKVSRTLI